MTYTEIAFLGMVLWLMLLTTAIFSIRTVLTLSGQRKANEFTPEGTDVSEFVGRLSRAHANCYENLPALGGILLYSIATDAMVVTDSLALVLFGARIAQSLVHMISKSALAVQIRFTFFVAQYAIGFYWLAMLFL